MLAFFSVELELSLLFPIFEPVIFYINDFGSSLFECTTNEILCCSIIDLYQCW